MSFRTFVEEELKLETQVCIKKVNWFQISGSNCLLIKKLLNFAGSRVLKNYSLVSPIIFEKDFSSNPNMRIIKHFWIQYTVVERINQDQLYKYKLSKSESCQIEGEVTMGKWIPCGQMLSGLMPLGCFIFKWKCGLNDIHKLDNLTVETNRSGRWQVELSVKPKMMII